MTSTIAKISGLKPGPVVAILAGVHGNELAGVYALEALLPNLEISKGTLYVAFANPPAIAAKVRMVNKNLNRCFYKGNDGKDPEDVRARELMAVLDECDALLDLHMFYDDDDKPFVICEDNGIEIAQKFDVDIISTNWTTVEPGASDGYMNSQGKIGICVECGPLARSAQYVDFAKRTIYQFLKHFDMTDEPVKYSGKQKRFVRAKQAVYKTSDEFVLSPGFRDFQALEPGQVIAKEGDKQLKAGVGECIIFPHYKARVGEEAYIIGVESA